MGEHLFDWNRPDITVMVDWYFKSQVPFHFVCNELTVHLELRISVSVMYVRIFWGVGSGGCCSFSFQIEVIGVTVGYTKKLRFHFIAIKYGDTRGRGMNLVNL